MNDCEVMTGSSGAMDRDAGLGMAGNVVAGSDYAESAYAGDVSGMDAGGDDGADRADIVPETPGEYDLPQSWEREGVAGELAAQVSRVLEADREEFMEVCHACRLTEKQAAALFDNLGGVLAESFSRDNAAFHQTARETVAQLWPRETARNLAVAQRGARFLKLGDALDQEGLSANPLVLRMAHAVGLMIGEDSMRSGGAGKTALPTGEAARNAMHKIIASDAYRRNDPEAIRKVEALAGRVGRTR